MYFVKEIRTCVEKEKPSLRGGTCTNIYPATTPCSVAQHLCIHSIIGTCKSRAVKACQCTSLTMGRQSFDRISCRTQQNAAPDIFPLAVIYIHLHRLHYDCGIHLEIFRTCLRPLAEKLQSAPRPHRNRRPDLRLNARKVGRWSPRGLLKPRPPARHDITISVRCERLTCIAGYDQSTRVRKRASASRGEDMGRFALLVASLVPLAHALAPAPTKPAVRAVSLKAAESSDAQPATAPSKKRMSASIPFLVAPTGYNPSLIAKPSRLYCVDSRSPNTQVSMIWPGQ